VGFCRVAPDEIDGVSSHLGARQALKHRLRRWSRDRRRDVYDLYKGVSGRALSP
jgi:hypothetical protein